jgi:hypothetical protein
MRALLIIFLLVSGSAICVSQDADTKKKAKPDLSGVWVLGSLTSDEEVRAKDKMTDYVMTIVHREPEIRITAEFKQGGREVKTENDYYTDGRRVSFRDPDVATRWRGTKLVMASSFRPTVNRIIAPQGIVTTVEWEISADGQTLTRTTRTTGMIISKVRAVFNRRS